MSDPDLYQVLNGANSGYYTASLPSAGAGVEVWGIIAAILAIVGGILIYFLFVNAKTSPKGKFAKWLKDFLSFKIMWIEPILKTVYYTATIFTMLYSFSFLGLIGTLGGYALLWFLAFLIVVPILIRIFYEAFLMFIMIWRNTRDIAANTEKKK